MTFLPCWCPHSSRELRKWMELSLRFPSTGMKIPLLWEKSADFCPPKRGNMPQKSLSDNVGAFFWGQIPKIFRSDGQNDGFLFVIKAISPPRWMRGGIFSQFPKPISQVRSRTIRVIIQVIAEIFCFLLFQKRFSSHATKDFGVFNAKMAILGVKARGSPQNRVFLQCITVKMVAMMSKSSRNGQRQEYFSVDNFVCVKFLCT